MKSIWLLLKRNLRYNLKSNLLLALGSCLAAAFLSCILLVGSGILNSVSEHAQDTYGSQMYTVFGLEAGDRAKVKSLDGIEQCGFLSVKGCFKNEESLYEDYIAIGSADQTAREIGRLSLKEGRYPKTAHEAVVEQSVLDRLNSNAKIGDTISFTFYPADGKGGFEKDEQTEHYVITGILNNYSRVWDRNDILPSSEFPAVWVGGEMDQSHCNYQALLDTSFDIYSTEGIQFLENLSISTGLSVEYNDEAYPQSYDLPSYQKYFPLILACMCAIIILISVFQTTNAVSTAFSQKKRQWKIYDTLGVPQLTLLGFCLLYIGLVSLIGIPLGLGIGVLIFSLCQPILTHLLESTVLVHSMGSILFFCGVVVFLVSLLAAWMGYRRVVRTVIQKKEKRMEVTSPRKRGPRSIRGMFSAVFVRPQTASVLQLIAVLTLSMTLLFPIQLVKEYYSAVNQAATQHDVEIGLPGDSLNGMMRVLGKENQSISFSDLEEIQKIPNIKDLTYYSRKDNFHIVTEDKGEWLRVQEYTKDSMGGMISGFTSSEAVNQDKEISDEEKEFYGFGSEDYLSTCCLFAILPEDLEELEPYVTEGEFLPEELNTSNGLIAVHWKNKSDEYPYHPGDTVSFSGLVEKIAPSENEMYTGFVPASRYDVELQVVCVVTLDWNDSTIREKFGLDSVYPSFLTVPETLLKSGYPMDLQNISFNYEKEADIPKSEIALRELVEKYPFVQMISRYELNQEVRQFSTALDMVGIGFSVLIVLLGMMLLYNSVLSVVYAKRNSIALMRILGTENRTIQGVFCREVLFFSTISSLLAMVISGCIGVILKHPAGIPLYLTLVVLWMGISAIGIIATSLPVHGAFKHSAVSSIARE